MSRDPRAAVAARDAALARTRRLTAAAVAAGLALTAAFTAVAAGSTHLRKTVVVPRVRRRPAATGPVSAPVPPLVAAHEAAPAPSSAPAPSPAPAAVPQPVTPVVVSGGS
jgi:hypothetical protein